MPQNPVNTIKAAIPGFYRSRLNTRAPGALRLCPVLPQDGLTGQFVISTSDGRFDLRDGPKVLGINANYEPVDTQRNVANVVVVKRFAKMITIGDREAQAITATAPETLDPVQEATDRLTDYGFGAFLNHAQGVMDGLAAPAAGALDISTAGGTVVDYGTEVTNELDLASNGHFTEGDGETLFYVGPGALRRFLDQDQIFAAGGLAGDTGTDRARTGAITPAMVEAWFRDVLGWTLVVERRTQINTSAANEFAMGTTAYLVKAAPGSRPSCLKTAVQSIGRSAEVVNFETQQSALPTVPGVSIAADGVFTTFVADPQLGRKITLTL